MSLMLNFDAESLIVLESSLDALAKLVTLLFLGILAIGESGGVGKVTVGTEFEFNGDDAFGDGVTFRRRSPWLD
jgi:hypothetical protein